jgi:hypothetical protein
MKRAHTSLAVLTVAVFSLAACGGDDGGDDPDTTDATDETTESGDTSATEETASDLTIPDISMPDISIPDISLTEEATDMIRQMFPDLSEEQASCLVEAGEDLDPSNPSMEIFEECDVELSDLTGG